tara:strand:- start:28386 stop:29030 length:645 start_codon:yes stop_codon:yes gene_type:complete
MANKFISTSKNGVGTSAEAIYTVELRGTETEKQTVIIGCNLANTTQTAVIAEVSVNRYPAFSVDPQYPKDDVMIVKNVPIPAGSAFEVMQGQKIILEYNEDAYRPSTPSVTDTLAANITSASIVSITITDNTGPKFVQNDFIRINNEILKITSVTGANNTTLNVDRGQANSTSTTHTSGDSLTKVDVGLGDEILVKCDTTSALDCILSIMEVSI